jgi:hypothetical protein
MLTHSRLLAGERLGWMSNLLGECSPGTTKDLTVAIPHFTREQHESQQCKQRDTPARSSLDPNKASFPRARSRHLQRTLFSHYLIALQPLQCFILDCALTLHFSHLTLHTLLSSLLCQSPHLFIHHSINLSLQHRLSVCPDPWTETAVTS